MLAMSARRPSRCASCSDSSSGSAPWRSGIAPTADELAEWANKQRDARGRYRIFGRAIDADEARVILRHPGRLVTVRPSRRWLGFVSVQSR